MDKIISSELIKEIYSKDKNDEDIFALIDGVGINIIRNYEVKTKLNNKRMFIKFYLSEKGFINGGVDMVEASKKKEDGYKLVFEEWKFSDLFKKKFVNYIFNDSEKIILDLDIKKIKSNRKEYSINEFINLLVKRHKGGVFDMFWLGRLFYFLKTYFILEPLFWLANLNYKNDMIKFFLLGDRTNKTKESNIDIKRPEEPFFKYFRIYKNTLLFFILYLLIIIFWLSITLENNYFTITNPLFLFLAFLFFAILEKISDWLFYNISEKKDGFIYNLIKSTLNIKGKLKL